MQLLSKHWLPLTLILLVVACCYSHTLEFPFLYDDKVTVSQAYVQDGSPQWGALWDKYAGRFLPMASLALQSTWHLESTVGFHLVNTLIHLTTCGVIYFFLLGLMERKHWKLALFLALVFAAHPLNTQAVTYISQRLASLVTLFYLTSTLLYFRYCQSRHSKDLAFATVFAVLAALSKQNAVTIAGTWVLLEFFFGRDTRKTWPPLSAAMAALSVTGFILFLEFKGVSATRHDLQTDITQPTQPEFILTQPLIVLEYLRLFVWPAGQSVERDVVPVVSLLEARFFLSMAIHLAIIGAGLWVTRKKHPLVGFGILFFYLTLLPESSFFPLEYYQEHRLYLPMTGLLIALGGVLLVAADRTPATFTKVALGIGTIILVGLCITTYQRNLVWESRKSLWTDVMEKAPNRYRGYHNVGIAAIQEKDYQYAIEVYLKAIQIAPQVSTLYNNLGHAAEQLRNHKLAISAFTKLVEIEPTAENFRVLAGAYETAGSPQGTAAYARRCLQANPTDSICRKMLEKAEASIRSTTP